jgi:hypothetical protein
VGFINGNIMNMAAQLGGMRSDTIHANMCSRSTLLAGKPGNTHVVPPKCRIAATTKTCM